MRRKLNYDAGSWKNKRVDKGTKETADIAQFETIPTPAETSHITV